MMPPQPRQNFMTSGDDGAPVERLWQHAELCQAPRTLDRGMTQGTSKLGDGNGGGSIPATAARRVEGGEPHHPLWRGGAYRHAASRMYHRTAGAALLPLGSSRRSLHRARSRSRTTPSSTARGCRPSTDARQETPRRVVRRHPLLLGDAHEPLLALPEQQRAHR
jgi:hypothetical protein